jgi:hypothetical protein
LCPSVKLFFFTEGHEGNEEEKKLDRINRINMIGAFGPKNILFFNHVNPVDPV